MIISVFQGVTIYTTALLDHAGSGVPTSWARSKTLFQVVVARVGDQNLAQLPGQQSTTRRMTMVLMGKSTDGETTTGLRPLARSFAAWGTRQNHGWFCLSWLIHD